MNIYSRTSITWIGRGQNTNRNSYRKYFYKQHKDYIYILQFSQKYCTKII